jgi:hypothetical protein
MTEWLTTILTSVGASMITCVFMEAYYQRRARAEMGNHDEGME